MEIINLRKMTGSGKLRAFFDLETPKMIIRGMKLLEGNDGNLWVGPPSREYTNKDGEKKWSYVVEITDADLRNKISSLAREAYHGPDADEQEDVPF